MKDEQKSKFLKWYAINSTVNSLPTVARKDPIELKEYLLKEKQIVLNQNFEEKKNPNQKKTFITSAGP